MPYRSVSLKSYLGARAKQRTERRWRVGSLAVAIVLIVALPYFITRNTNAQTQEAGIWVVHSAEVRALTCRIAYVMRDSEAAEYRLLTGAGTKLTQERAQRARRQVEGLLAALREDTSGDPFQQAQIGSLQTIIGGRLGLMAEADLHMQRGDTAGALRALQEAGTLFPIDNLVNRIVATEDQLLVGRRRALAEQLQHGKLVLALTAIAQILLLGIIVLISEKQITSRQRAEEAQGIAIIRSRQIVQSVREPIALLDGELRLLMANAAFNELYHSGVDARYESLDGIGDGVWDDKVLLQRLRDVLARDRELWDYELRQTTSDGVERHVLVNARRLQRDEEDERVLLLTVSDVTARMLSEQQVIELNRQLQGKVAQISDVNRELEAFSYSVSHDLRAPLRHIAGFADKLQAHLGESVDEKSRHYLEVIGTASRRMALLIDDLLVFSRLGRGALRLRSVDMQSLVEEARELATVDTAGRHIEWRIGGLPVVVGDENMLRTAWQNLLGNAVKYTAQRENARIEVGAERQPDGGYVFTVRDNGAGFDMQYAGKLFGVFQRLHRTSEFPGNGIGLANVRRIVTRHGGRVWAEGVPDQGASFHFYLPAAEPAQAPNQEHA